LSALVMIQVLPLRHKEDMTDMDWNGHALLGRQAALGLSDEELFRLVPAPDSPTPAKRLAPEFRTRAERLGAMCLILDWIYQPEFAAFCRRADGGWIPHTPVGFGGHAAGDGVFSEAANVGLVTELLAALVDALRRGDPGEAELRAGVLGHFLQEPFTPGHSMDNRLFPELFPDPDPSRHIRLHHAFDSASGDYPPPEPRVLGNSIDEAALRLWYGIRKGIHSGRALVGAVIAETYRGADKRVLQNLLLEQSRLAAQTTADAWRTACAIAVGEASTAGEVLPLTEVPPYFWHASEYVEMLPGALVRNGRKIPIEVYRDGDGVEPVAAGFGFFGHSGAKYYLGNGVFSRFRCRVGLAANQTAGQNEHTDVQFAVELDATENLVYSEDIEYRARRVCQLLLRIGEPPRPVEVMLDGARTLILSCRATPWTDAAGVVRFAIPHLAICEPELIK